MPRSGTPRNPWFWTVLTLLHERPMHPYEIQQLTAQRGKDLQIEHKPGSLYSVIDRLRVEKLIAAAETSRDGNLPERTSYRITDAGRDRLLGWLRAELGELDRRDLPRFAFAVEKIAHLAPATAADLLRRRTAAVEEHLAALDEALDHASEHGVHRVSMLEVDYVRAVRTAELDWLRRTVTDVERVDLAWTAPASRKEKA